MMGAREVRGPRGMRKGWGRGQERYHPLIEGTPTIVLSIDTPLHYCCYYCCCCCYYYYYFYLFPLHTLQSGTSLGVSFRMIFKYKIIEEKKAARHYIKQQKRDIFSFSQTLQEHTDVKYAIADGGRRYPTPLYLST